MFARGRDRCCEKCRLGVTYLYSHGVATTPPGAEITDAQGLRQIDCGITHRRCCRGGAKRPECSFIRHVRAFLVEGLAQLWFPLELSAR